MDKKAKKRNAMNNPTARISRSREKPKNTAFFGSEGDERTPPSIKIAVMATNEQ
jgi:hypothetical protein